MAQSSLHIQISAHDRPGILAEILGFIVDVGWNVVDIKQFVFNASISYFSIDLIDSPQY